MALLDSPSVKANPARRGGGVQGGGAAEGHPGRRRAPRHHERPTAIGGPTGSLREISRSGLCRDGCTGVLSSALELSEMLAGWTGLEPAASGVTGRHQRQHIAADPGKSGSAVPPSWLSDADRGRVFGTACKFLPSGQIASVGGHDGVCSAAGQRGGRRGDAALLRAALPDGGVPPRACQGNGRSARCPSLLEHHRIRVPELTIEHLRVLAFGGEPPERA